MTMVVLQKITELIEGEPIICNGVDDTFTTANNFDPLTLKVYVNGQRLAKDVDFEITGSDEFRIIHYVPRIVFILLVDYEII